MRRTALAAALLLAGCAAPQQDEGPVHLVAPDLAPPPARSDSLTREGVLEVARSHDDPAEAIRRLDASPFAFRLDPEALSWFGGQGLEPAVLDYLEKRSQIDWAALRGDVDPNSPE